jgi:hypothetical protein
VIALPKYLDLRRKPNFRHKGHYDIVLIDGGHGYPFPEIDHYHLYQRLKTGALLIVDDLVIPTIGRMAEVIREDDMFDLVAQVHHTAIFRRTDAPMFTPRSDGWFTQKFNRRANRCTRPRLCCDLRNRRLS